MSVSGQFIAFLALCAAAQAQAKNVHCPSCGKLVCAYGFTAQSKAGHCCPYCVNEAISTAVVKDPAYYAKKAHSVYRKYGLAQEPFVEHCPACGNLVCPHGFTAQSKAGHCCPYCVNKAISTEVVKDPAYYAKKANPVYKKYVLAQEPFIEHCPACGNLVCPHGFTAQSKAGHCCPYCVNKAISTEVVKDPAYYAKKANPVYKKYVLAQEPFIEHCPVCGKLVCPHGFTSQSKAGHCCPYCVNNAISTEVVKDSAYYAKKANRVYKKFVLAQDPAIEHCPACGKLVCPHGFTAQTKVGHCCPYCVNRAVSAEVVKDPVYYAKTADPVYKKYTRSQKSGH